jgi:hypothetical protein
MKAIYLTDNAYRQLIANLRAYIDLDQAIDAKQDADEWADWGTEADEQTQLATACVDILLYYVLGRPTNEDAG